MSTFNCPGCSQDFDRSLGVYIESGDFVCRMCQGRTRVAQSDAVIRSEEADRPRKQHIIRGAISAFIKAFASLLVELKLLFFLLPLMSGGMALATLIIPLRDPETRRALGWKLPISLGFSALALLISIFSLWWSFARFDQRNGY